MQPYLHQSRHNHASRRLRGPGGRFLTSSEAVQANQQRDSTGAGGGKDSGTMGTSGAEGSLNDTSFAGASEPSSAHVPDPYSYGGPSSGYQGQGESLGPGLDVGSSAMGQIGEAGSGARGPLLRTAPLQAEGQGPGLTPQPTLSPTLAPAGAVAVQ